VNKLDQIGASHQLPILARISERCHLVLLDRHVKIRFFARTVPECNKNVIRRMLVTCANHVQVYEKKSSRKLVCCLQHKIYPQKKLCASHLPARSRSSICAWRCALMCAWRCASNGCSPALFHVAFQACGHCERSRVLSPKKHDPKLMFSHVTWYFGWRCMYRHGNGNGNNTV
jgi:hypothetical protein